MKSTDAARALAARRKRNGPEPVRRWRCAQCGDELGTNEMRRHRHGEMMLCLLCGDVMTRSQTRTHRCEEK